MPGGWVGYLKSGQFFPPSESTIYESSQVVESNNPDGTPSSQTIVDADSARRSRMRERVDLFRDNHKHLVTRALGVQYEQENFSEVWKTLDLSNNICKKIITQISTIYDSPPNWTLSKDDGGAWKQIRRDGLLDLVMPVVNRYTNLCNEVLLHISVIDGKVKFNPITPDLFRVWSDPIDPTRMVAYAYSQASGEGAQVWHYWSIPDSAGQGGAFNRVFQSRPNEKLEILFETENPYVDENGKPVLPGLLYHNNLPLTGCLDSTTGEDIVSGAVMVCCMESGIWWMYRCDSAAQKYVAGELAKDGSAGQVGGPQRFLTFRSVDGSKVDVGQFKSQADWLGLRSVINDKIANNANNYGLAVGALEVSGTPQSGFALKVRKEPLLEIRKRQIPIYRASDERLYATTAAVWNHERKNVSGDKSKADSPADGKPMLWPSETTISIGYASYNVPMSPTEMESELLVAQVKVSMGTSNVAEIYQQDHPELTIEECEDKIRKNVELTKSISGDYMLVIGRAQILNLTGAPVEAPVPPGSPAVAAPAAATHAPNGKAPAAPMPTMKPQA